MYKVYRWIILKGFALMISHLIGINRTTQGFRKFLDQAAS